jgi:lipopolysaccharide transport system permease protein
MALKTNSTNTIKTYRDLILAWTGRTIRARYQQSILGGLWAVIQPTAYVIMLSVIFTRFIPINTGGTPYVVFSFVALAPWTFLSTSLPDMVGSLVENMNLVTKIYFPKEIIPISVMLARLVDFAIAFLVLVGLMLINRLPVLTVTWLYFPLVLAVQIALILGLGLLGSALNVFYRDVRHIFTLGLQLWLYASPIIYPVTLVPEQYRLLYFLNPMAGVIESYRTILLHQGPPSPYLGLSALVAALLLVLGYAFFKRVEFQFADVI